MVHLAQSLVVAVSGETTATNSVVKFRGVKPGR